MTLEPHEWNTVIVGGWNPAILTPKGIAKLLFEKPAGTPIEIRVPLDGMAPSQSIIDNIIVSLDSSRLIIGPKKFTLEMLDETRAIAIKAMEALPMTPLTAAGFNVRYLLKNPPENFFQLISTRLDDSLSDATMKILSRQIHRSLEFREGRLNFEVYGIKPDIYSLLFNFERSSSKHSDLTEWLKIPMDDIKNVVNKILYAVLALERED